jgi:vancomycin permeability regulator SanA
MVSSHIHLTSRGTLRLPVRAEIVRGLATFLGLFLLADRMAVVFEGRAESSLWMFDLGIVPSPIGALAELLLGIALLSVALGRHAKPGFRRVVRAVLFAGAGVASFNGLHVLYLGTSRVTLPFLPPFSFLLAACLGWIGVSLRQAPERRPGSALNVAFVAVVAALLFPVVQVFTFGNTSYSRPADVAVVFGARTYASGRLSTALEDRVNTACALYRAGLVSRLLMSGGPGDGAVHETEAMRRRAISLGVPERAILLDRNGVNTRETVKNTSRFSARRERVIAVSEFYHLPRIKLAYGQAGIDIVTVPAKSAHWARRFPVKSVLREIPAFWSYYFGGLVSH